MELSEDSEFKAIWRFWLSTSAEHVHLLTVGHLEIIMMDQITVLVRIIEEAFYHRL